MKLLRKLETTQTIQMETMEDNLNNFLHVEILPGVSLQYGKNTLDRATLSSVIGYSLSPALNAAARESTEIYSEAWVLSISDLIHPLGDSHIAHSLVSYIIQQEN